MSDNKSFIEAHLSGENVLWIDMMFVPKEQRGKGIGTQFYEEWEKSIPESVTLIKLMAADTGDYDSTGFWDKMGFSFVYDSNLELDYETAQMMWKGVNGNPTPKSIFVDN